MSFFTGVSVLGDFHLLFSYYCVGIQSVWVCLEGAW